MKKPKVDREYPSLSILCEMYEVANDPKGLAGFYGAVGTAQAEVYSQACADLGDRVHKALEAWESSEEKDPLAFQLQDQRENYMVSLIKAWILESGMEAVDVETELWKPWPYEHNKAIEVPLNSDLLHFSSRADRIVKFGSNPKKWVGDYKTSASMKDSYKMQLAGYALGWWEKTGEWIDDGFILRVEKSPKKKTQIEPIEVHDLWKWLQPLVYTRQLWDFLNSKGIHANDGAAAA